MTISQKLFSRILFAGITLVAILHSGLVFDFQFPGMQALMISRWLLCLLIIIYAFRKKSLTTWILISMLIGVEFGHDFPAIAIHLNLLSKIFLRMVKTIIAPLLFATLVVGIAGHSDLKQVGRMG